MKLMISDTVQTIFNEATLEAKKHKHEFVTPEHVLWAMMFHPKILELFTLSGADLGYMHDSTMDYLKNKVPYFPQDKNDEPVQSLGLQTVFDRAVDYCINSGKKIISFNNLVVGLFDEDKNHCSFFMRQGGINRLRLLQLLSTDEFYDDGEADVNYVECASQKNEGQLFVEVETIEGGIGIHENDRSIRAFQDFIQGQVKNNGKSNGKNDDMNFSRQSGGRKKTKTALERFTVNLTEKAREGLLSPLIGRTEEIERTIQILCRKQKNNVLHVGSAGVGKTAITEGLAQKIAEGNVPSFLKDANIYAVSMSDLMAGSKFRGDFEDRLKHIAREIAAEKNSIMFIDEIHTVIDTNGGSGIEAPDLLKPLLSGGKIRCIGATTYEEYERYFLKDKALARRFQKVDIEEPSEDEALKILQGLRSSYEDFHRVRYSDEVLRAAVHLSALHIRERFLPDKAIDLIDEAGALLKIRADKNKFEHSLSEKRFKTVPQTETVEELSQKTEAKEAVNPENGFTQVSVSDIDKIVAKTAKIPEQAVSVNETEKLKNFEEILSKKIFGQAEAITGVTKAVKRSRAGFRAKEKPVANFLFVGPTGVGKTELAKTLAEELGVPLLRFDMSEYQEKHTVSRLIGSPPGYVGFEDGGLLTESVRKQPNSVLLLDEIEKAHRDIYNILLQIMDYATLTDNQGRKASFNNVILIMTSNAGSSEIGKPLIGFGGDTVSESAIDEAVEKTFTPEFRNRLDAVIKFGPLTMPVMSLIVKKEVEKIKTHLAEKEIELELSNEVIPLLAEKGYSPEFGARNAARLVEDEFVTPLTDMILFGTAKKGGAVSCTVANKSKKPYLKLNVK
ncbi:ATP-dependent Clp protease ATP-binding subunit ClpA [Treponema pedis]|uniref:ATP-dependent Clp protease ATP-binding subunit ClpA n=1 Tax=Treponema pedis TaxID=409322 RepID=A0A7S6WQX6_9SPIR|nr:ATP-dependent Clp protease ATP-binding subunit ClpA [Treponema pedis]QOW61675.1 ATP-dependent Clp protease ATP-binding subunit ClpA [Treponema pedis]